jgi:hypothetical protein
MFTDERGQDLQGTGGREPGAARAAPTLPVITSANSSHLNTTGYQLIFQTP